MSKFDFKVWRDGCFVTTNIFVQPKEKTEKRLVFAHEDIEIWSECELGLSNKYYIYISGSDLNKDNLSETIRFNSLDEAEFYRGKIFEALSAFTKYLAMEDNNEQV